MNQAGRSGPALLLQMAGKTWRAARNPAQTREQIDVLIDYVRFERRHGRILRSVRSPADGPRLLVVSLSDWPFQLKLEGVLAKGLELQGLVPTVLTLPRTRWARRYFGSFGVERFATLEQFESDEGDRIVEQAASSFLSGEVGVQALKALDFQGAHVGIQTLSSLSRTFQRGRISLDAPPVREALERILRQAMRSVITAQAALDAIRPDVVMFIETGYAGFGSIFDVALDRGLNVVQYGHAGIHRHDALNLKRFTKETRRFHPASLSDDTWRRVRELPWTDAREKELAEEFRLRYGEGEKPPDAGLQEGRAMKTPEQVRAELGLRPGRKLAVVFSHVLWDANLFYGDDLFEDQETWLVETVRAACANPELDWAVKLHPANAYKAEEGRELNDKVAIREAVGELPPHVRLIEPAADINTYSIFRAADYGITIRGTIGIELPCFGIPVLTAGTGRYSGRGLTMDSASAPEYLERLARLHELPRLDDEQTVLAKRHAYALFRLRPCPFTSFRSSYMPTEKLATHPLGHNLELTIRSESELRGADDLRRFGEWAVDRSRLDYVSPFPEA